MKSLIVAVAIACTLVNATPLDNEQVPFGVNYQHPDFPGFDLSAQRLIEMEGQPAVWMSELEKVIDMPFLLGISLS
jgi:leucyl aminopeptidase